MDFQNTQELVARLGKMKPGTVFARVSRDLSQLRPDTEDAKENKSDEQEVEDEQNDEDQEKKKDMTNRGAQP